MTTKELKNKLKITEDTVIHCQTLELAKKVLDIFHKLGLKWCTGKYYMICTNWDRNKENTVYHPFDGVYSSLEYAQLTGYKIISAEEFITLHTEKEEFDLENYEPKGELIGFPKEIIARMVDCQEEQGNPRDINVFEENKFSLLEEGGFDWDITKENIEFWGEVIIKENFDLFFKKYPKQDNQDNSQEFNLENYVPKGELEGFPKEIIARMLACQEEQGNKRDVNVFEKNIIMGFIWDDTKEGGCFWYEVIMKENFDLFFEKYPKKDNQDNSQEFNLENYEPKGQLTGFPKEIIARMLECQEEQGTKRDVTGFEKYKDSSLVEGGFDWHRTKEKYVFWYEVICNKDFDLFFKQYPKKDNWDNSQEFKVGDEVIDIISGVRGKVTCIDTLPKNGYPIFVNFDDNETAGFTLDGRYYSTDKYPRLLHYRDDYDYSVIDFNNLPKRQEANRWRAERNRLYYFINFYTKDWFFSDETKDCYDTIDNENYNSGNYFRTEVEAEIIAQKLNTYFKQLIIDEHDTHRN